MRARWDLFFENIQQDFKVFLFVWLVLNIQRVLSIGIMSRYIEHSTGASDILTSLYYGARISMKTAGIVMVLAVLFATLPGILFKVSWGNRMRLFWGGIYLFIINLLFLASFPYYNEFHTSFNQMMFNALKDDQSAILHMIVEDYHLFSSLFVVAILTVLCVWGLKKVLRTGNVSFPSLRNVGLRYMSRFVFLLLFAAFAVFVRFGGSLVYAHSLHWENASMSRDSFLNEMILDDVQAVYRGWSIKKRIENGTAEGVDKTKIKEYLQKINTAPQNPNEVDSYLVHEAKGNKIAKPKHIFIIIGESYAQWPALDKYADLHIADGLRGIMKDDQATTLSAFMPNGAFTPMAINAIISGLSDVNIYPNQQQESYCQVYSTAFAPQMKKLGYKTCFWYAGFSSWERIKDFAMAQGFDEFHSASDFPFESGNVWGADDKYMFNSLKEQVDKEDEPTVHVIMTVSNHAPYSVDLAKEGFDEETVKNALPEEAQGNQDLMRRLGHYWYMDKMVSDFVHYTHDKYPDSSLFMITGDHADRTNIDAQPTLFERYTIPFVIYGNGIEKNMLPQNRAGGQINIAPTLFELIAPKGFTYYSLANSLFEKSDAGFNHNVWTTDKAIGEIGKPHEEILPGAEGVDLASEQEKAWQELCRFRTISWWRTMQGNEVQ